MIICISGVAWIPTTRSRVDCGLGLVMASFWPIMRLRSVDLPAFGFPATVTTPALVIFHFDKNQKNEKHYTSEANNSEFCF